MAYPTNWPWRRSFCDKNQLEIGLFVKFKFESAILRAYEFDERRLIAARRISYLGRTEGRQATKKELLETRGSV